MKIFYTISLLILSNIFMTIAWYGHLKFKEYSWFANMGLIKIILFSWMIALLEYMAQVPANKIGFAGNGGPFYDLAVESDSGSYNSDRFHSFYIDRI